MDNALCFAMSRQPVRSAYTTRTETSIEKSNSMACMMMVGQRMDHEVEGVDRCMSNTFFDISQFCSGIVVLVLQRHVYNVHWPPRAIQRSFIVLINSFWWACFWVLILPRININYQLMNYEHCVHARARAHVHGYVESACHFWLTVFCFHVDIASTCILMILCFQDIQ